MSEEISTRGYRAATDYIDTAGPVIAGMCERVLEGVDEIDLTGSYPEDDASEVADSAVPIYTHEIMAAAAESAEIFAGPDDRGLLGGDDSPERQITVALCELASNVAHGYLYERQKEWEAALEDARELGRDAGRAAGTWAADGNSDVEERRRVLAMLEDGDPEAWDYLPNRPNLSGEFADDLTPAKLADELGFEDATSEMIDALADAYEEGVSETFESACEEELRKFTS